MLKRSVIATDITSLTDARYFAARGVDYLLYDLRDISINEIMAIVEWVEGVKTIIRMEEENIHLIDEVILRIAPHAIGSENTDCLQRILQYSDEGQVFHVFPENESEKLKIIMTESEYIDPDSFYIDNEATVFAFSKIEQTKDALIKFIQESDAGIILSGSFEEEVGLKSFEVVDQLLDQLEEN